METIKTQSIEVINAAQKEMIVSPLVGDMEFRFKEDKTFYQNLISIDNQMDYIEKQLNQIGVSFSEMISYGIGQHGIELIAYTPTDYTENEQHEVGAFFMAVSAFNYFMEDMFNAFYREAGVLSEDKDEVRDYIEVNVKPFSVNGYDQHFTVVAEKTRIVDIKDDFIDCINVSKLYTKDNGDILTIFGKEYDYAHKNFGKKMFKQFRKIARKEIEEN